MKIGKGTRVVIASDPAAGMTREKSYQGRRGIVTRISTLGAQAYVKLSRQGRERVEPHLPWSLECLEPQKVEEA